MVMTITLKDILTMHKAKQRKEFIPLKPIIYVDKKKQQNKYSIRKKKHKGNTYI